MFNLGSEKSSMHLESEHFIVDKVKHTDKENLKLLEESRPWAKIIQEAQNVISDKDKSDYFEELWEHYKGKKYFWCIYRRDGQFCGVIQLDKNSDMEYQLYIQLMDDAPIEGFGTELFEDLMEEIVQESGAKHLEFELWDATDRSKIIFEELGIDVTDGEWQYDC